MSLLNTDQTPASFWITSFNNIWVGNVSAGGPRYSFWFDPPGHPLGPSATTDICPENVKLGEFSDNISHSVGRYGLRIFHKHSPRERPCDSVSFSQSAYDAGNNPYTNNPVIPAIYQNFLAYKNGRNGVIAEDIGAVRFVNITTVDHILGGIEINRVVDNIRDDTFGGPYIDGALVIGRSYKSEGVPETFMGTAQDSGFSASGLSPHGIITPQSDFYRVKNVKFYNFNFNSAAALGSCSHCFKEPATDSDGRTIKFEGLYFDDMMGGMSVTKKIRYQFPYKSIFYDVDGTLTGDAGGWAINDQWSYNAWGGTCDNSDPVKRAEYDGFVCDSSVTIRSVLFYDFTPGNLAQENLMVLPYDYADNWNRTDEVRAYEADESNYGVIPFRGKQRPKNHWKAPFVTGHTYYLRWSYGLDFEKMKIEIQEPLWDSPKDADIQFEIPFYDVREKIIIKDSAGETIGNKTLSKIVLQNKFGDNFVFNETFEWDNDTTNDMEKRLQVAVAA